MRARKTTSLRNRLSNARRRGLTLIETALALAIMSLVVASLSLMMAQSADQVRARSVADKIIEVHEASKGYVKANFAALLSATASGPVVIPSGRPSAGAAVPAGPAGLPSLQGGGFLSSLYVDANGYGQRHSLTVRRLGANRLEAIVTTHGGVSIPDRQLGAIANMVGAAGGFMPQSNVVAADAGQVVGAYGGWRTPAAGWGPAATRPSVGRLAATLAFEDGNLLTDYLYRHDIGIPEANRMSTNIDMNGNELHRVQTITGTGTGNAQNVNVTGTARVSIDVWAGRDLEVTRDASVGRDLDVTRDASVGRDLDVTRNARVRNNLSVDRNATVGQNLTVAGNATVENDLRVNGTARIADELHAGYISLDSRVFNPNAGNSNRGISKSTAAAQNIRLGDLLPRMVPQYSYRVTEGSGQVAVPKPLCANNFSRARIMLYRQTESNRATPVVGLNVSRTTVSGASVVSNVTQNQGASRVDISDSVFASDSPTFWTVQWSGTPQVPGTPRQVIAQTFCYYP